MMGKRKIAGSRPEMGRTISQQRAQVEAAEKTSESRSATGFESCQRPASRRPQTARMGRRRARRRVQYVVERMRNDPMLTAEYLWVATVAARAPLPSASDQGPSYWGVSPRTRPSKSTERKFLSRSSTKGRNSGPSRIMRVLVAAAEYHAQNEKLRERVRCQGAPAEDDARRTGSGKPLIAKDGDLRRHRRRRCFVAASGKSYR